MSIRDTLPYSLKTLLDEALSRSGRLTDGSCDEMEDLMSYEYLSELLQRAYDEGYITREDEDFSNDGFGRD